jgi:integrase
MLGEHYAGIRRWAPAFLDAFVFQAVPAAAALMRAIDMLRDMNRRAVLTLPKSAPISFIRERWARHVLRGGRIDRRYYELCVLSELRNRLRAGDVWVVGSRRYRAFEERLISRETLKELEGRGTLCEIRTFRYFWPYQRAALLVARWSGARRGEICRLAVDCLDVYPDGTARLRIPGRQDAEGAGRATPRRSR